MRLFEAIIDANHRALAGDQHAGLHPAEFESELPVVALTCIDVRLNPLLPEVLGIPKEQFIWLRNAGNIVTSPLSSTMRSLSMACAIKGGKEIAIIGHTDCQVSKTTTSELLERLQAQGIERHQLPANVNEYFGIFTSVRANVIKAVDVVRSSPIIGPKTPVHGLLVDIDTGRVEWLVNGYQALELRAAGISGMVKPPGPIADALKPIGQFDAGEFKFPEGKIGDTVGTAHDWLSGATPPLPTHAPQPQPEAKPATPPRIPLPPPIRPRLRFYKGSDEYKGSK